MAKIIGRKREKELLEHLLSSGRAEFFALYGRRRVGKTYLVRNFFAEANCVFFHITGIQNGSLAEQLEQFVKQIGDTFYDGAALAPCRRWLDAFAELTKAINRLPKNKKVVLFFDEFPWMATKKSRLLQALDHYWNRYWVNEPLVKLVVCGSSASWVLDNIINNKGGLYNRITRSIKLEPFSLAEVKLYLKYQGVSLNNQHILALYMALGGIPHYLSQVEKGKSTAQCIDELCFQKNGLLFSEFERLFKSLFTESDVYLKLCQTMSRHRYGIGQADLLRESKVAVGGRTISRLKELEDAGFIMSFIPYGHVEKGIYYKIIDEYTLFYFQWIKPSLSAIRKKDQASGYWLSKSRDPSWKSWAGYAFEAVCYKHISNIRKTLQIDPGAEVGSWRYVPPKGGTDTGAQIDLLFDRPDDAVTICEIKYNEQPYAIDKPYAKILLNKSDVYTKHTQTKKQIFIAMITSGGLKPTMYSEDIVSGQVVLNDLFIE